MIPLESWPDSSALGLMRVAGPIGSEGRLRFLILREGRFSPGLEIGGGTLEAHHKNMTKDLSREPGLIG